VELKEDILRVTKKKVASHAEDVLYLLLSSHKILNYNKILIVL